MDASAGLLATTDAPIIGPNASVATSGDPDSNPPKGLLFHGSGPIDEGWGVIDFWESRAAFDEFQGRIQQAVAASGVEMQGPPDIKEFPVHETFPR